VRKVQSPLLQIFTFVNMTILSNDIYFFMRKMEESNCALRSAPMHRRSVLLVHNSFVYHSWYFLFIWFRLVLWSWFLSLCYASLSYIITKVFASYWHLLLCFVGYTSQQTCVESSHDMLTLKRVLLIWIVNQRNIYCVKHAIILKSIHV
jgi:hypothetical protein